MSRTILDIPVFKKISFLVVCTLLFSGINAAINIITPLPTNLTKCEGDSLILSISLTSDNPCDYVWKRDTTVVGTNSPILIIPVSALTDSGTYTCQIKEQVTGATNIQTCRVGINPKPVIVTQPNGAISPLCEGNMFTLTADVQNATMVWKRNGTNLVVGSPSYTDSLVTLSDSGYYYVLGRALLGCKDVITDSFHLSVRKRGLITNTLPASIKLRDGAGMDTMLTVSVTGDGPFDYQWYKDNTLIPGANADTYYIYDFTTALHEGVYKVIVNTTFPCNDTLRSTSSHVKATLCPLIIRQTDTLINACMGGAAVIEVEAVGAAGYQWFKTSAGSNVQDSLEGAIYNRFIIANADSTSEGYYNLVLYKDPSVTEDCSLVDRFKRVHVIVNPRQAITTQPMSSSMPCNATSYTLSATASNATGYQWYRNGVAISGATSSTYTVNPVTTSPDEYKVHVLNPYCTDEVSNGVLVRNISPMSNVFLTTSEKLNLLEQCIDAEGWTYYAHPSNLQEMLFAIRKNGNNVVFSPDIRFTNGYIKELAAGEVDKKVVFMGLRMFTIKLKDTSSRGFDSLVNPYDVKFYFDDKTTEMGVFLSTIQSRRSALLPYFSSDLPVNELSFVTSTHQYMTPELISNAGTKTPIGFEYNVVTDGKFGRENNVMYVEIDKLITSKGGGTFYYHYYKTASSGINNLNDAQISVYPNPSTDGKYTIVADKQIKDIQSIKVYNLLGTEVKSIDVRNFNQTQEINCSNLSNGNYLMRILGNDMEYNLKLTISK